MLRNRPFALLLFSLAPLSSGASFNRIPISEDRFLLIRGEQMRYGEKSSCERPAAKNRIVVYDSRTNKESLLFDKPLSDRMMGHDAACVYESADVSPSESTLYIVSPCYATSGCLAIVDLPTRTVRYVPGVNDVFVVRGGPNAGDLIYSKRSWSKPQQDGLRYPYYPYIHARPDGSQIGIISDEALTLVGGNGPAPILRAYLRRIHGRIYVQGEWIPQRKSRRGTIVYQRRTRRWFVLIGAGRLSKDLQDTERGRPFTLTAGSRRFLTRLDQRQPHLAFAVLVTRA